MAMIRLCLISSVFGLVIPGVAEAQLTLCNRTVHDKLDSAVGYKDGERWISRGWYALDKDKCVTVVTQPLTQRYYYIFAQTPGRTQTWNGALIEHQFCVLRPEPFTIYTRDCATRNYIAETFVQIDTGTAKEWTQSFVMETTASSPSGWNEKYKMQVEKAITESARLLSRQGYDLTGQVFNGNLKDDGTRDYKITLEAGRRYRIIGRCDDDCTDLDLRLYNATGTEVNADVDPDKSPVVGTIAAATATYSVRVVMAECSSSICYYSIGVLVSR